MPDNTPDPAAPRTPHPGKGASKTSRIPIKVVPAERPQPKPHWIRAKSPTSPEVARLKGVLREQELVTVCEEASCPNLGECFAHGTATFMILGEVCTRRCPFCDVAHGRPEPPDPEEPRHLADTVAQMGLEWVVITSVDRDDLRDGGAQHFVDCITALRETSPGTAVEILVPDFRGRQERALAIMGGGVPDVFNHNLETVPRLYKAARPGADYEVSLRLLADFRAAHPQVPTKSGLMLGIGEEIDEVEQVMADLRDHGVTMLTLGQYLSPGPNHLPVHRYVHPDEFDDLGRKAKAMGFEQVASGPMVRSSYHADRQAAGETVR
ncbi:lipoic acid synthetase [Thiohalospira halophila DSM 15071]|uniref:Lipoyl synthase n=1 Tax=Thiohalospira halophila DSM 15071 TaxID=1123397 RepID=A0A1I1TX08_9GAMM|nr:lipoyl synthase [Thiohalospira halophila]SFD60110.1 lipoic acid synthetase [Thiohalospira halophila DSM 15071]